jgi:hypothetical protein
VNALAMMAGGNLLPPAINEPSASRVTSVSALPNLTVCSGPYHTLRTRSYLSPRLSPRLELLINGACKASAGAAETSPT